MHWAFVIPNLAEGHARDQIDRLSLPMDSDAFAGFYERSARPLWAYLVRVSGDPALADDLMQESYVRFLCAAQPPKLEDGEVASRRYLFRIATNLLRDYWRKPKASSLEDVAEEFLACPELASPGFANGDAEQLGRTMARLRPRDRQLLWLAHAEGYSHREIAEITGLASASIRLLLFRARRKMAQLLQQPAVPQPAYSAIASSHERSKP